MTSGVPWSVKGIDPKARETAKDLARRSGLTLGEWLNQVIDDRGGAPAPVPPPEAAIGRSTGAPPAPPGSDLAQALDRLSARIEAAESRSTLAISGIDQSVRGVVSRMDEAERDQTAIAARFEHGLEELAQTQTRLMDRLRRVEDEAAGPRSAEALRALEGSLGKVAHHLYDGEARTREVINTVRDEVGGLQSRIQAVEVGLVDAVVARIAERLDQAEARTTAAIRCLEGSFAGLDDRLSAAEARIANGVMGKPSAVVEQKLEQLAINLSASVDAVRAEMAEKLRVTADSRHDRVDHALREMTRHVEEAERRSAQAIERMGQEVLKMADAMGRRMQGVETRSADSIEQVGGEVARIADQLETRLHRADTAQAQALEKLGGEIARITERLAERITNAERRSAQAIDDVGEQVSRVTDRITQRYERSASDLAERIRLSEERTARILDEAKDRIDQRLSDGQRKLEQAAATPAPAAPPPPAFADPFAIPQFGAAYAAPAFPPPVTYPDAAPFGHAIPSPEFATVESSFSPAEAAFGADDLEAADGFGPAPESDADFAEPDLAAGVALPDTPPPPAEARTLSTRELIDQARAAARAAASEKEGKGRKAKAGKEPKDPGDPPVRMSGFSFGGKKRRASNMVRTGLLMSGAAASVAMVWAGVTVLNPDFKGELPKRVVDSLPGADPQVAGGEPDTAPMTDMPRAAVLIDPQPIDAAAEKAAPLAAPPAPAPQAAALYAEAVRRIQAKDNGGVEPLKRAAALGYAPAQFYLGDLYEDGEAGLTKNLALARQWTERAANNGEPNAMHSLAYYYYNGQGGPRNLTSAAQWFRQAADLGVVNSQYNLAKLYESGEGVPQNLAQAYVWYQIAARSGDAEARAAADRLSSQISSEAQSMAQRSAGAFTPQRVNPSTRPSLAAAASDVATAQKALETLGYYKGPIDGTASAGFGLALKAFQTAERLTATGSLDSATAAKLAPYAR